MNVVDDPSVSGRNEEMNSLLAALSGLLKGDASVRLPLHWSGVSGKVADAFNAVVQQNADMTDELIRLRQVVGKEGKLKQRASLQGARGFWGESVECINSLIDDLVHPTSEVARVIGAVAQGDFSKSMALEVDGRPLEGEFLRTAKTINKHFFSHASRELGSSLDAEVTGTRLLEMLVPRFASGATLALCDSGGGFDVVLDGDVTADGEAHVWRRSVELLEAAEAAALASVIKPAANEPPTTDAASPFIVLPLSNADRIVGAIRLRPNDRADRAGIVELIERSSIALENARLYRTLQMEIEERRGVEALLQTSNRRKDEFLAMLSHELRNPLAPIRTALEVIRRLAPAEPKLTWATDVTGRQVAHLTRLVEDLLDVARINQGKIALQTEPLDLRAVIAHAVETAKPFIDSRRHHLHTVIPEAPIVLRGDFARLSQVVANLLNNAARYTDEGGSIELSLALRQGHAVISVRDNGVGIDAELLPNIFDLFEQGKRSLDRSQGGLGIGLTLVRRLVDLHQGTVTASSAGSGRGSEFQVVLPCLSEVGDDAGSSTVEQGRAPMPRAACRILVVDDNYDAAEATKVLLELGGHEVKMVGDGGEALASAPVFAPDVVLLDIGLPQMDGYQVAKRLRELPETRASCLIALTGYGQPADRERARAAGFDHHLTKPADPDALLALVDAWIESTASQRVPGRGQEITYGDGVK